MSGREGSDRKYRRVLLVSGFFRSLDKDQIRNKYTQGELRGGVMETVVDHLPTILDVTPTTDDLCGMSTPDGETFVEEGVPVPNQVRKPDSTIRSSFTDDRVVPGRPLLKGRRYCRRREMRLEGDEGVGGWDVPVPKGVVPRDKVRILRYLYGYGVR